jgi:hypothetical protein
LVVVWAKNCDPVEKTHRDTQEEYSRDTDMLQNFFLLFKCETREIKVADVAKLEEFLAKRDPPFIFRWRSAEHHVFLYYSSIQLGKLFIFQIAN